MKQRRRRARGRSAAVMPGIAALGVAAGWLWERGRGRRHQWADQMGARSHREWRRLVARRRYELGRLQGRLARAAGRGVPRPHDDVDIKQLVHQALSAGHLSMSRMNIEVSDGTAVLRGEVDSDNEIQRARRIIEDVPGVVGVVSYLHLPGQPAANKVAARQLSSV